MPLLKKIERNESFIAGIWNISEPEITLRSMLMNTHPGYLVADSFKNETRRKQWIASRILLSYLLQDREAAIIYNESGKPFIKDSPTHISISHSGDLAAIAVCRNYATGIDIERIKDRVERVTSRFLSSVELKSIGNENRLEKLHVCWGAKEALYKLAGTPDVDFKKDITIHRFDYLCDPGQTCRSSMTVSGRTRDYTLYYEKILDYMLVYTFNKDL